MPWISGAVAIGGALLSSAMSSSSADKAADAQGQSTEQAIAEQRRQYDQSRADLEPWRTAGGAAVNRVSDLLGTSTNTSAPNFGALNRKFTLADFWDDPVTKASYQSGLDLGKQGIDRMAGARGGRNSGATLKALERFGTDYTGQQAAGSQARFVGDQTNEYNRLAGVAGTGQNAATTTGQLGSNVATNVGNMLTSQGNARGAAAIAGSNALSGGISSAANMWNQQQTLDKLLNSRGGGGYQYPGQYSLSNMQYGG